MKNIFSLITLAMIFIAGHYIASQEKLSAPEKIIHEFFFGEKK